jgi:hypothetical protein
MAVRLALMGTAVMVTKELGEVVVAEPMVAEMVKLRLVALEESEELID